jgi:hypothetical protein
MSMCVVTQNFEPKSIKVPCPWDTGKEYLEEIGLVKEAFQPWLEKRRRSEYGWPSLLESYFEEMEACCRVEDLSQKVREDNVQEALVCLGVTATAAQKYAKMCPKAFWGSMPQEVASKCVLGNIYALEVAKHAHSANGFLIDW